MAMAVCWNCGARAVGPTCQMCGAAQQPGAAPGQPVVNQASMSVRPTQPTASNPYAANGQYPYQPANQAGGWQAQPSQPQAPQAGWQSYQPQPGSQQPGAPQPGYQQPSTYQQQQAAMGMRPAASAGGQVAGLVTMGLVLGVAGGLVGSIVGALIWAFFLQITKTNVSYLAVLLGFLVGGGVLLGSRGQRNIILAGLAALLGLFSFFLALYFRLSLGYADALGLGMNVVALPFGDFFDVLKLYLQDNPINYLYFVLVPLIAGATAFRGGRSRRRWR